MPVTQHPLHRSVHAELPHTALASGRDDQTLVRVRVADAWGWQPVRDDRVHASPAQVLGLTAAAQRAMPQPAHLQPEHASARARCRARRSSAHARPPPRAGTGPARQWVGACAVAVRSLTACSLARSRLALVIRKTMNLPFLVLPQQCVKPRKSKVCGFALSPAASVLAGEAPELDQPRLVGVQRQPELAQPLGHLAPEALGIVPVLEPGNPVIGIAHDDHVALGVAPPPLLDPQIERVVQVDVGQQRADAPALHRPQLTRVTCRLPARPRAAIS